MKYNPNIHHRRSIRLKGYDYSRAGAYFITICVKDRKCMFGNIENKKMILNEFGMIAYQEWEKLPERFTNMELDVFQIMPNHMHGIIVLNDVGATLAVAPDNNPVAQNDDLVVPNDNAVTPNNDPVAPNNKTIINVNDDIDGKRATARVVPTTEIKTVGDIAGAYKSLVANKCLEQFKLNHPGVLMGKLWQRNYYEHIIRDEQSCHRISEYIINNPANWKDDKFYK
jgi:putative transposase